MSKCPKCSCPLDRVELPEGVEVESCPHCFGAYYDRSELAVLIELQGAADTAHPCPKCGGPLQAGLYRGELELEQCPRCRGLWFDARETQALRRLSGVEGVVRGEGFAQAAQEEGTAGVGPLMPPAALNAFVSRLDEQRGETRASPKKAKRVTEDEPTRGALEAPEGAGQENPDARLCPVVRYQDRAYEHFQTSWPVVAYVVGEFPWQVQVGEKAQARDFISPPFLLSQETSGSDSVWSHGEYLEPSEVWEAFGLPGSPPERQGVAPAQTNPHEESWSALWRQFPAFAGVALLAGLSLLWLAQNRKAFEQGYLFNPAAAEKSVVTDVFELGGRSSNAEVVLATDLNNQWAYFSMALINADTDVALDFAREVSYYTGHDEDGAWKEGSRNDSVILPRVPRGRYYLRIEPETETGGFGYTVRVTRDVPRPSFLAAALCLLALPLAWVWLRRRAFEHSRWMESDHPWTSDEDDDDE